MDTSFIGEGMMKIKKCDSAEGQNYLIQKLTAFNQKHCPSFPNLSFHEICYFAYDDGNVIGGIYGYTEYFGWLYVSLLYVEEGYRNQGIGSNLLYKMELYAQNNHCKGIYLNTWEFQAKNFYCKKGYSLFGKFENAVNQVPLYYLKKN